MLGNLAYEQSNLGSNSGESVMTEMIDLRGGPVEVRISSDSKTLWVNGAGGCILRIQGIESLHVDDMRSSD